MAGLQNVGALDGSCESVIEFTGAGYFLSFSNPALPMKRVVLDCPAISGKLGEIDVGYVGFIENSELTLECFSYDCKLTDRDRESEFVRT